ncbi:MAG TPA: helix-turn-helix domain-containing protein [Pseudonocardia sp.]|uniref:helix-turn-helix domain-containing protein n=1 Tax=Pseudonocardia sp. TaxID=60912 RepID=UPI002B4B0A5C|nr:helix-turn-helix domain-containing protein [Pseudonocardia sp.]HLU60337.1 helix-turn-helix domain-containing protein [Pseudonocardia sp.]
MAGVRGAEFWRTSGRGGEVADEWRAMLSATHLPWAVSIGPPDGRFTAWVRRWWIDDLALVDCGCGPCSGTRTRRELAATDGAFVVVLITLAGRETVVQNAAEVALRPGDAVAWDSTRPARFAVSEPLAKRSLLIPRAALEEVFGPARVPGGVELDGRNPATRLLTSYLDTLRATLPELDQRAISAARNATLELFAGALRAGTDAPTTTTARPALRAQMERYIDGHLLDALTPAEIASVHGVSVRTVNRIFNATGQTVGEVIRVRRLARAREELSATDRAISSIAHRWGFADTSHFSRCFKARYGTSPSDYRHATRGASVQRGVARVQGAGRAQPETGIAEARGGARLAPLAEPTRSPRSCDGST